MNENHPLYPMLFFSVSVLLAIKVIRVTESQRARLLLSWQMAAATLPSAVFAWAQTSFLRSLLGNLPSSGWAELLLTVLEAFAVSLCIYWFGFRKLWGAFPQKEYLMRYALTFSSMIALALWGGSFEIDMRFWLERLFLAAVFLFLFTPALLGIEWRLGISPVPKMLKGRPIFLISSGLLALGLLGLSGIF